LWIREIESVRRRGEAPARWRLHCTAPGRGRPLAPTPGWGGRKREGSRRGGAV